MKIVEKGRNELYTIYIKLENKQEVFILMNISFFLQPKSDVAYIYSDDTIRQGMQKMNYYGYTAIPVLDDEERYVGTITEGDFLWNICDFEHKEIKTVNPKELEKHRISDLCFRRKYPSVKIDVTMEELIDKAMRQNYVPVVDDRGIFIGIIRRRDIIKYFTDNKLKESETK